MHTLYAAVVLGFLIPTWIVAGTGDWWRHRKSDIEHTAGWKESALHIFMIFSAGGLLLAALIFKINALFIVAGIALFIVHEIVSTIDFTYAAKRREIGVPEQRVHDYLTAIPFAILLMTVVAYWEQTLALIGLGQTQADFSLRLKSEPLPFWYFAAFFAGSLVNVACYLEEFVRCWRARV